MGNGKTLRRKENEKKFKRGKVFERKSFQGRDTGAWKKKKFENEISETGEKEDT